MMMYGKGIFSNDILAKEIKANIHETGCLSAFFPIFTAAKKTIATTAVFTP